jgi:hypothetical protein
MAVLPSAESATDKPSGNAGSPVELARAPTSLLPCCGWPLPGTVRATAGSAVADRMDTDGTALPRGAYQTVNRQLAWTEGVGAAWLEEHGRRRIGAFPRGDAAENQCAVSFALDVPLACSLSERFSRAVPSRRRCSAFVSWLLFGRDASLLR